MQISRLLRASTKINSRKNYCETVNLRNSLNLIPSLELTADTAENTLTKMCGVQLWVMNRWFVSKEKPVNMIGMLFLWSFINAFKKMLLRMFCLTDVNRPPNSCSFQINIWASLWLEREWTEVLNLAWTYLLTIFLLRL